jgi:hypothetical protein
MKKMAVRLSLLVAALTIAGCNRSGLDSNVWKFSGTDAKRGIDHYYSKPSVKKVGEGVFSVTTKAVPTKGEKAVEEATNMKNVYAVATIMEVGCKDKYVRVMEKDYQDKDGISLKVEKDEMSMDSVRSVTKDMPIFTMYQEVCR